MTNAWLAAAAKMPVAFAQVREDPRVDLDVLDLIQGKNLSGIMIASGGCTAAAMVATGRFASLHLVDANPAQLALTRLKLFLLQHALPQQRLELLGHLPLDGRELELRSLLATLDLPLNVFGPIGEVARLGPDCAGRYELLFARFRTALPEMNLNAVSAADFAPGTPRGIRLDAAFDEVMALPNLIALFGEAATQNSVEPFSRHFAGRTRHALAMLRTHDNPFLWQMLAGGFPPGLSYDWIMLPAATKLPDLQWSTATMLSMLEAADRQYDFVHLSNILDWLSPPEAAAVLRAARRALKPGGVMIIRQLNSSLDLPALGPQIRWLPNEARQMHAADRSFFYRQLHLGQR